MKSRDKELDLLTAALIGLAVGATATLLLRRGPTGSRPLVTGLTAAGRGALWAGAAGATGARAAAEGTRRGVERGMELLDELPLDEVTDRIGHYFEAAKGALEDTVRGELEDLRKSIRRQRKRLGV
jgi:hypothetical protein